VAQILIRNLEDEVKQKLQQRARRHGHSTEEEVREILRNAVRDERARPLRLGTRIAQRFEGVGLDEEITEVRDQPLRLADFES
jgi:plasmid stability protein